MKVRIATSLLVSALLSPVASAASSDIGDWYLSTQQDAMNDKIMSVMTVGDSTKRAHFFVKCVGTDELYVGVIESKYVADNGTRFDSTIRFDSKQQEARSMVADSGGNITFFIDAMDLIQKAKSSSKVAYRRTDQAGVTETYSFSMSGSSEAINKGISACEGK